MSEHLYTAEDVATLLGVKKTTVYSLVRAQQIPHVRLGTRAIRFRPTAIDAWLAEEEVASQ